MIYRVDRLPDNQINPFTSNKYDETWMALALTFSADNKLVSGVGSEGVYFIRLSILLNKDWELCVGDFIGYCEANNLNGILVMSQEEYQNVMQKYLGHSYNEANLRKDEPNILIHSTTAESWESIKRDGMLKSWNRLKSEAVEWEDHPIGDKLGDIEDFQNYIMFGGGVTGEIVVSSKQAHCINMDINAEYRTGARLYFDAKLMAEDGLLIRDGAHIKVRDTLPLAPYLIWAATWDVLGLSSQISTPKIFAETADEQFRKKFK